jgi:hypothetical protein
LLSKPVASSTTIVSDGASTTTVAGALQQSMTISHYVM